MKLILSVALLISILLLIKHFEKQDPLNKELFISKVIESDKVKYLTNYKMGVDYYNNEAGKLSNFLSNALKFRVVGANPKQVIENVSNGKFHFGIVKENLLQDAFFGQGVFDKKHLNLRIVSRMYPISLFFVSLRSSINQVKSMDDIRKFKTKDNIRIGIYSPKYKFPQKISSDEKDPSILIYYKLFNHLGLKMGDKGSGTYQLEIYGKRDKLLEALKNKEIEFCGIYDVFTNSDILNKWSINTDSSNFYIFGLESIPDHEIKFMFPRMKISNLDLSLKPYDKNRESTMDDSLVNDQIVKLIIDYLFKKDNYFWNNGQWSKVNNRDTLLSTLNVEWKKFKDNQLKRNLILLQNQLLSERDNALTNIKISSNFIKSSKTKINLEKKYIDLQIANLKKSVNNTKQQRAQLTKKKNDLDKDLKENQEKVETNAINTKKIKAIIPEDMNDISKLKDSIKYILLERNKLLTKKSEIIFNEEPLNLGKYTGEQRFPYWNPLTVNQLKKMDNDSFKKFIDGYSVNIDQEIKIQNEEKLKPKNKKKIKMIDDKIKDLKNQKNTFLKYQKQDPNKLKIKQANGYIDITKFRSPMSSKSLAPVTFKTVQEYYVLFSEEDVPVPPVYNVLYSFIKLPNDIKSGQSKLLIKTDYNLPLHPAVKVLYTEYDSEQNTENICKNRISNFDCIIKGL